MTLKQFLGDSHTHAIPLTWQGSAFSPDADWLLIFTLKANAADPDTSALFQKASGAGISVTGSTAEVSTVPQDTDGMDPADRLPWDIQAQNTTTGEVRTVAVGRMSLSRDVTRQTTTSVPVHTAEPPTPLGPTDVVRYSPQALTTGQAAQARANIGAQPAGSYVSNGDERLGDARTPLAHRASHLIGGSDALFRVLDAPARIVKSFAIDLNYLANGDTYSSKPVYEMVGSGAKFIYNYNGDGCWSWRTTDLSGLLEISEPTTADFPHLAVWMGGGGYGVPVFSNVVWGTHVAGLLPGEIAFYGNQAWRCASTDQTVSGTVWESISSVELAEGRNNVCFPPLEGGASPGANDHFAMWSGGKTGLIPWWMFEGWLAQWFEGCTDFWGSKTWYGKQSFQGGVVAKTQYGNSTSPMVISASDYSIVYYGTIGSGSTTLPLASSNLGRILCIKNLSASWTFVVNRTGSDTIDGATSKSLFTNKGIMVQAVASGVWIILAQI